MAKTKIEVDLVIKGGESVEQVENKTKSLKAQLKEIKALLASGTLDSQTFNKLAIEAGNLQDRIADVSQRVKNLASDSQKLDTLISATQGIVGGFAAVQGITALVSEENEDLQKTMMKLQGAMSALAGIQAVANALNKDSALMTTVQTVKLRVLNFVEAQRAASLQYTTVAMQKTAFAARMLSAVLATLGIGAIIAAVVYLIPKITEWISGTEAATKAQVKLTDAIESSDSALENYTNQIDLNAKKELSFAKRRGASAEELAKITIDAEEKKLKALEKTYKEQGALYDKLNDGMVAGTVKMDRELLKQQGEANVKRYEDIVSQSEKISLLKIESNTDEVIRQREADKKAKEEQKIAAEKRKAEREKEALAQKELKERVAKQIEEQDARDREQGLELEEGKNEKYAEVRAIDTTNVVKNAEDKLFAITKANKQELADREAIENAKLSIVNDSYLALNALGELALGQQFKNTAVGKSLALAQIATDTAVSFMSGLRIAQKGAEGTGPLAPYTMPVFYASQVVAILGAANKAKALLGGGGGVSAPSGSGGGGGGGSISSQPPRMDKFESNRPAMNPNQRVYVLEKDITDSQGRVARIRHNATLI
jgi:hypothetical protein